MRFFGKAREEPVLDPEYADSDYQEVPISSDSLIWDLTIPGLTTQYKSFYFSFEDGSAGYLQIAYGNLGMLVKVCPLGYSYYSKDHEAVVGNQTLRSSSMRISEDRYSVHVAQHSIVMDTDCQGWRVEIVDSRITYKLHFKIESQCFAVSDFGRKMNERQVRHVIIPQLSVSGQVTAHESTKDVKGFATYIEAFYTNIKFTDSCNEFTNFQLRGADANEVLTMMQVIPRNGLSSGPCITHGSYTKDGKVVAISYKNSSKAKGTVPHLDSGYSLPSTMINTWSGQTLSGESFEATGEMQLSVPSSITDGKHSGDHYYQKLTYPVLSIFPKFFKDIVSIWAGLPYVFCWRTETVVKIDIAGVESEVRGISTTELTHVHKPVQ